MSDRRVFTRAQDIALLDLIPRQTVAKVNITSLTHLPFHSLALQNDIRLASPVLGSVCLVLGPVEDVDVATNCLGCYEVGILRHVSGPIDLSIVVDSLHHADPCR